MFSCLTAEFHWVGTWVEFDPLSGMDSCCQRDKNMTFPVILASPERRLMTARNRDAGDKKMLRIERTKGWA